MKYFLNHSVCKFVGNAKAFLFIMSFVASPAFSAIHKMPIVLKAKDLQVAVGYPLRYYNLYAANEAGVAVPIPYQIDEIDANGDYVLDKGKMPNTAMGNGLFDFEDELSLMGDDVGVLKTPTRWPGGKRPAVVYEIRIYKGNRVGAVYLAIDFSTKIQRSSKSYVFFNQERAEVLTSRYHYRFDKSNYLVVRGVDEVSEGTQGTKFRLIDSSTFYLKADLKYFLTFQLNQRDVNSELEAFKTGPVRTIVRVMFFYKLLQINFELGMYTEVSLFSNSVELPALMHMPINGPKVFNKGSGFYYGFAISESPMNLGLESNIRRYDSLKSAPASGIWNWFSSATSTKKEQGDSFWISMKDQGKMMYFVVSPSEKMLASNATPYLYAEPTAGSQMSARPLDKARPLGESPVNLGLYFELDKFDQGEHLISFKLFFDNIYDENVLSDYRSSSLWEHSVERKTDF